MIIFTSVNTISSISLTETQVEQKIEGRVDGDEKVIEADQKWKPLEKIKQKLCNP